VKKLGEQQLFPIFFNWLGPQFAVDGPVIPDYYTNRDLSAADGQGFSKISDLKG
jgi:hypothetical protein